MPAPAMSSTLENTSAILGEYMLKGWTLTDLHCDTCRVTPLMRESPSSAQKNNRTPIQFCAQCDGSPSADSSSSAFASASHGRPTSVPEGPNRSDDIAQSISGLMLKGYSLLGENCDTCSGVPLVGWPKNREKKSCVGCGRVWVKGSLVEGKKERAVVEETEAVMGDEESSPRSRMRRELYAQGTEMVRRNEEKDKGKGKDTPLRMEMQDYEMSDMEEEAPSVSRPIRNSALHSSYDVTTAALSETLNHLSTSLSAKSTDQEKFFVEAKLHTEAMKDVLHVLGLVEKLKRGDI
ncbi:hypothetical protein P7C73_g4845, partial [Tremellales sp. Uapishka_1]